MGSFFFVVKLIISVGYRVKSQRGIHFRIWASGILKEYMRKGFVMDDQRLKELDGGGYIQYLSEYQKHIFVHKEGKSNRKYIGIVIEINGIRYYAPLSSYKDKHKKMRETVDFIKIKDYAVINLNNMIPVPSDQIIELDINKEKDLSYRYLLQAESREVNRQKNRIRKNAEIVHSNKIHNGNMTSLAKRTNDFDLLEKLCKQY